MRTRYRNGDPIGLKANGCDGCSPVRVNYTLCHEAGCPDAWRDEHTDLTSGHDAEKDLFGRGHNGYESPRYEDEPGYGENE